MNGPLLAIGGAEDKFRDRVILRRFIQMSGGENARLVIIPTASSIPDAGHAYRGAFRELGAACAEVLSVTDRSDANRDDWVKLIEQSSGIFLTGGNQLRVASMLGGTRVAHTIATRNRQGVPVAGTSAGASVMSTVMVAGGRSGSTPQRQMVQMSPGLGLVDSVIIDQHFRERDRLGRLVTMVSYNPSLLGLGIDEDTAAILTPDARLEVLGRGTVLIVDGTHMVSNVHSTRSRQALTVANVTVHFLAQGACYDLEERMMLSVS